MDGEGTKSCRGPGDALRVHAGGSGSCGAGVVEMGTPDGRGGGGHSGITIRRGTAPGASLDVGRPKMSFDTPLLLARWSRWTVLAVKAREAATFPKPWMSANRFTKAMALSPMRPPDSMARAKKWSPSEVARSAHLLTFTA